MRLGPWEIRRAVKAAPPDLRGVDDSRGWFRIFDWKAGAWQQDAPVETIDVMAQATVFSCVTLIASDIGKLRLRLVEKKGRIWQETTSTAFSPVLRRPNHYQTRQQFVESWIVSKLSEGNTYVLKVRDARRVVTALYVLDPKRCHPLVAPDGSVYYRLAQDELNKLPTDIEAIPASEVIHDRMVCLFHPLVGVTPLYAATLPAQQALQIQQKSKKFFQNNSQPGGILSAPGKISEETAARIKTHWENNYTGDNAGRVAVLGDSLTYSPGAVNPVDAQLVEQLGLTAPQICSAFHVPPFMVGAADAPPYGNIGPAVQQYYNQCLQSLIESLEASLDHGLGIGEGVNIEGRELGTELDLDALLRMDKRTQADVEGILVQRGIHSPDEAREVFGKGPVTGGKLPYLQQQNYSLAALAQRDSGDPFAPAPAPMPPAAGRNEDDEEQLRAATLSVVKECVAQQIQPLADTVAAVAQQLAAGSQQRAQDMQMLTTRRDEDNAAMRQLLAEGVEKCIGAMQPRVDALEDATAAAAAQASTALAAAQETKAVVSRLADPAEVQRQALVAADFVAEGVRKMLEPQAEKLAAMHTELSAHQAAVKALHSQPEPEDDTRLRAFMQALNDGFLSAEPACV